MVTKLLLVTLSVIFLSAPWLGAQGWSLLVALVPLLILQNITNEESKSSGRKVKFIPWVALTFLLWQFICTFWIMNATVAGMVVAVIINTLLTTSVFCIYNYIWKRAPKPLSYTILVTLWLFYEWIYLHGQISWPWLTLGFGFANTSYAVQWYEYTGSLGGSLWSMVANIVIYNGYKQFFVLGRRKFSVWISPILIVVAPLLLSIYIYHYYRPSNVGSAKVQVIQPNIDPFTEKFGTLSNIRQQDIILSLANKAPSDVDYIIAPETALDDNIWENDLSSSPAITRIKDFLVTRSSPAQFIVGATTYYRYASHETHPITARYHDIDNLYYSTYNSALAIDTTDTTDLYHKSKLVIGVETMPYPKVMKSLERYFVDLGGMYGQLGTQDFREVFTSPKGKKVGVAICYESVYGEFLTDFVDNGAQALFIITNDGWWGNTPGYRQHFSYARLRAIELRRYIARSANTGISGFIDDRGRVISKTKWDQSTEITEEIVLNSGITFYAIFGDYIGRLSMFIAGLSLLYFVSYTFRKRNHLNN